MKRLFSLKSWGVAMLSCFVSLGAFSQGTLPLVAETDFSVAGAEADYYHSIDMVDGFGNSAIQPHLEVGTFALIDSTAADKTTSTFLNNVCYAVTPNPIRLDSVRMFDNENSGEWGFVFSGGKTGVSNRLALRMTVGGLLAGGRYSVVVEYCNPHKDTYLNTNGSNPDPHLSGDYSAQIKVGTNASGTNPDGAQTTNLGKSTFNCLKATINSPMQSSNSQGFIQDDGVLRVDIVASQLQAGQAVMIKSIKVYAEVDVKIVGVESVCAGGEKTPLSLGASLMGCKYQWIKNGTPMAGETSISTSHESGDELGKEHTYQCEITTPSGSKITAGPFVIKDDECCTQTVNGVSVPATQKLIWMDDFGTFTSATNYWVWDYTDISNPKKVSYTDGVKWQRALADPPEDSHFAVVENGDCNCPVVVNCPNVEPNKFAEGYYTVAANVYSYGVPNNTPGVNFGWAGYFGDGREPHKNEASKAGTYFAPDHTYRGSDYGAMLYLNIGSGPGSVIYKRKIEGLCDRKITLKCYLNNFSQSTVNPISVKLRVTDLASGTIKESPVPYTRYANTNNQVGIEWVEARISIDLTGTELLFEILSASGGCDENKDGNDLILDDIMIYACSQPSVDMFFDLTTHSTTAKSCLGDDVSLNVEKTKMIETNVGPDAHYLYQYSTNPSDLTSWKTIAGPTQDLVLNDLSSLVANEGFVSGDKIYFRTVLGLKSALSDPTEVYNPNAPCAPYSISDTIALTIDCPECTEPQQPKITAVGGKVTTSATSYTTINLCHGESTELSIKDITGTDKNGDSYKDYLITWHKGSSKGSLAAPKPATTASTVDPLTVKWADATSTGTWFYVRVHDVFEDAAGSAVCDKLDSVFVIANPKPDKPSITIDPFCDGTTAPTVADVQSQVQGYTINWKTDAGLAGVEPNFATITPGTTASFYLSVTDAATGCESDTASFTVTVNTIPSEVLAPIADFCEGDATAALPTSTKGYTVAWTGNTTLSTVQGATTPQNYTYTLTDPNTGCVSGNLSYTFTVMPIATLTLTVDSMCDKTTITATPVPATATVTWADASTDLVKEITDATQLVDYSATASLAGYCDSETETVAAATLTLTQTPKGLTGGKVQYLKSDMATSVKNLVDQAAVNNEQAYSGQSAGTTLYWSAQLAQGTQPGSYTDITSTSVPTPAASSLTNTNDEFYSYWIYETTGGTLDCKSEMKEVQVSILGAPAPKVRDTVYCLNDVPVALDKLGTINQADASKTYELLWTTTKGAAGTTNVPIVSTATPGRTPYYVSQAQKDANGNLVNESSQMEIIIDVYEVLMPTAQDIETCKDVPVSLSATAVNKGTHQVADAGFVWFTDTTLAGTPTAPTPDVSIAASTSYFVGQSYTLTSGQVCTGPKKEIVVKVNDTDAPAPGTVQFVAADGQSGAGAEEQFPSIVGTDKYVEEAGDYEYFYAEGTDATTKPDVSAFSTTKPAPVYDKDQLNGGTKTLYYWVYRKNKTTGCPSEPSLITVNISDAMPPKVKDYYVCQGEAVPDLVAEIQPLGTTPVSNYSLIWYGTDPTSAGTPDGGSCKYTSGQTSATAGVTTYYVAQKDNSTGAVSAAMPIKVTILANPITLVTPPAAVCETEVDLASTWKVTNVTDALTTGYLNGATELASSKVTESGTYTITNKYVNDYSNIGAISVTPQTTPGYCVGTPVNVTVTIDTLSTPLISGSLTACPGIQEELKVSAISNVASISYSWDGAITATGDKIMGGTTNSTKGQTFTYTVTATAGTCSETSAPHTITVGDGPVEGVMTATETDNSLSQFKFTDDNGGQERVVYACGNELTLDVNYNNTNSVAGTEFTWYDGATSIGTGASIQIPATTTPASKTYEVKYFNKCAASAKVTVHFVPLGIDPTLAEKPLTLCEGNPFNLKFEHNSSAILQPQIKWFKNGTEIANETKNQYTIASTTSADNGKYGFEISFKGCKESVTLTDLTVIPAISVKLPATPTICEGEEVDLEVTNIQPQGTTVSWEPDATIVSGENSSKATVKPTYTGGASHQAEYVYTAVAFNSICNSTEKYPVKVLVDEALKGSISGRNAICENESTTLNATAYDASTYTWKEGATVLAQSGVVTVKPLVTTTYEVEMTRGKCSATDNYMVEVTTNPVIVSVDSVGVRDRQVITEAGKGTAPFEFWYDENTANASVDDIFYGLTFTTHVAHVKDINGCQASYKFILDPPAINVPEFFTPNGDGVNDKWVVGSLAEVYPDALVVIYDRFGKELIQFKGGDIDGWDGTYNGVPMPSTDYWYVIDIEEIDMQYSGHFTLLRQ